ncbi:hypothetical protein [Methanothermococcus sp.]|nr:hypothetical protein [Methanothermococcus sp.]
MKSDFENIEVMYYRRYSTCPDPILIFEFGKELLNYIMGELLNNNIDLQ